MEEVWPGSQGVLGEHPPATTMVEVQSLIDSEMLIEVEAEAIIRSE